MKTVKEVSKLTGVSIRTLHYYDKIGLLQPTARTESGYRLYDDTTLEKLQHILLFRELEFPLKEIQVILDSPNFDRNKALKQQIDLLTKKKEHLENLIEYAREIKRMGVKTMNFSVFDKKEMEEYAAQAKATWGDTQAYKEFEKKNEGRSSELANDINQNLMKLFVQFGQMRNEKPESDLAQAQAKKLQDYITEYFYNCRPEIFSGLADMYASGSEMTENIDKVGGAGTAEFAARAIKIYCQNKL